MTIVWSLPVRGERLTSTRGDVVRAHHLIEALRAEGHDVVVVEDAGHGHTRAAVATYRTVVRSWLTKRAALVLRDAGRCVHGMVHGLHVAAAVRATGASLVVETQVAYTVSGAVAASLTSVPLVLDDCSPAAEEGEFGAGLSSLARGALSWQARRARAVVAVSPDLARMLEADGVPREKIVLVPNGISARVVTSPSIGPWRPRCAPAGACVVGFAGSFQPWHRVDLLIEALAQIPRDCRIHVVLAGSGPGLDGALAAAATRGVQDRVTVLGAVPAVEIPAMLSSWDIGVMPHSNAYGDPMKLREYAAAGVASVAPDLPPIREVIDDGVTGLLFRPGDSRGLAHALGRLSADIVLRRRLGDAARRRALEAGTWRDRARALLASVAQTGAPGSHSPAPHAYSRAETRSIGMEA